MIRPSTNSQTRTPVLPHHAHKYYIADPMLAKAEMAENLQELTFNCKQTINKVTQFCGANNHVKDDLITLIRARLREVRICLVNKIYFLFRLFLFFFVNKMMLTIQIYDFFAFFALTSPPDLPSYPRPLISASNPK